MENDPIKKKQLKWSKYSSSLKTWCIDYTTSPYYTSQERSCLHIFTNLITRGASAVTATTSPEPSVSSFPCCKGTSPWHGPKPLKPTYSYILLQDDRMDWISMNCFIMFHQHQPPNPSPRWCQNLRQQPKPAARLC